MDKQSEKDIMLEFIAVYRSHECLWKVKCKEYSNKNKRNALEALLEVYKKLVPDATKNDIQKINTLRCCFRREIKKVTNYKKSGIGTEEVYTSSLYYFEEMAFLADQDIPHQGTNTLEEGKETMSDDVLSTTTLIAGEEDTESDNHRVEEGLAPS